MKSKDRGRSLFGISKRGPYLEHRPKNVWKQAEKRRIGNG